MKLVICIPGKSFSDIFIQCWTEFIGSCFRAGHDVFISQKYSSMVHFARTLCLGADILRGVEQKPFDGKVDYDYILWIDSDIVFSYKDFEALLESPHDVTSGLYRLSNGTHFPVVKELDNDYLVKNGRYEFLPVSEFVKYKEEKKDRYMKIDYCGMGWLLIKKGVIEKIQYPWFYHAPIELEHDGKKIKEILSEDVSFCLNIKKVGIPIYIDTNVIVGHEKSTIL